MTSASEHLKIKIDERKEAGIYRSLKPGNSLVDFCSNDYLGFARSAVLKEDVKAEFNSHPLSLNGSTGSRLLSGNSQYAEDLEQEIAAFHEFEAGLLFNSGYDANLGLLSSLAQRGDTIILDELIHASAIDGARLSNANRYSFKHNSMESLEAKLKASKGNCYVVVESIYSMDGDSALIKDIVDITERYGAHLIVDEAHAVGLFKKGLTNQLGLQNRVFATVVTFGKALGSHGAIVLGSKVLKQYLINFARPFIYSTAPSFHHLASIKMAYRLLNNAEEEIINLKNNIAYFKKHVDFNSDYPLLQSDSAIQCIILKNNDTARLIANTLQSAGLDVRPILSPTVAAGTERIRICLHSFNTLNELALLCNTVNNFINAR
ncbi:aminotransferase class I/II-fold pyridoxal phosphate-dependent enzyme [Mucilaginibacter ginsenosidivorax]|uniref:Pyridoxal phosphate-dependent aminotransferase family protein n=1 Tax=Mucilaginibacter ginsenosidivorax TaxID=862126 RepID=A0A5B8VW44_9SPHI|nr:pyridoxal phosphate-dependent aminotransferase family protein [Mucilaginibacter ginsenosidivorax]QEC74428.1 pyridoxal phosphate-dependent aminotransferase family protein [Mucilaginibacter ginsenosidivorax]QEC80344.1 pyridoxal phosphate-dependent aminotransferase family protein [Mucilaginibacter ginsenosidivorax]